MEILSNNRNSDARRIGDIHMYVPEDVEPQLCTKFPDKLFSIQLHEATHITKDAHLIVCIRFCVGMSAVERLLLCKLIELTALHYLMC